MNITDALLNSISPYLSRLERLHIAGCRKVTHEGVWSVISNRIRDLKELNLEVLSRLFVSITLPFFPELQPLILSP
jgi:hypothetical protein